MDERNPGGLHFDFDAYKPAELVARAEAAGVAKVRLSTLQTLMLAALAGAFIAFGALVYTLVITGSTLGFGPTRLMGGVAFSLGLILCVVGGAELFTGNNLLVMAWADRKVTGRQLLRNWGLVYAGNMAGAFGMAVLVSLAGTFELAEGEVGRTMAKIALAKLELPLIEAFFRGVLCNILVCLAVWLCFAARSVTDKIFAIIFPISAFVGLGFEHSVANMYVIPAAMMADGVAPDILAFAENLIVVTLGNVLGGAGLVALVYWVIYGRAARA